MASEQKQGRLPVPVGGINTRDSPMTLGPEYGYTVNNFLPRPTGLEVRRGYRRWLPYANIFASRVQTLMFYSDPGNVNNKLFAVTADISSSIYDITIPNAATPLPFSPGAGAVVLGEFSWVNTTTVDGGGYLITVLFGRGYFVYNATSGWQSVTSVVGPSNPGPTEIKFDGTVTAANMMFIFTFKNRVWFLEAGKARAWFLPLNSVFGQAKPLELGKFLIHGGGLAFACTWTYDGGAGIDDNLVFVGNNGDMVIYQGSDPDVANDFKIKGQWFIGRTPPGRRGFCQYGGDTLIVSEYGIMSVSDFVSGKITNPTDQSAVGGKYNPTLARFVSDFIGQRYWQLISYPTEELIFLCSPSLEPDFNYDLAFTMGHFSKGWSTHSNLNSYTGVVFNGSLYLAGKNSNVVYLMFSGANDDASYDGIQPGAEVTATFQAGFYDYGSPTVNKTATRVKLLGTSDGQPAFLAYVRSEYDLTAGSAPSANPSGGKSLWDTATWNSSTWQVRATTLKKWFGVAAFGKKLAVQIVIRGTGKTLLTDYEVTYKEGNGL